MSWFGFAAVFCAFFLTHSVPLRPQIKARLVDALGSWGFTVVYALLSTAMVAWLIWAAAQAPFVMLWDQAPWQKYTVAAGMFAVVMLLAFTLGRPNPFSFGGTGNERFDARHPGVVRWTRHPVLLALGLWAGLHMLPNGDLAHVILFGSFAGFALLGMKIIDRRKRRLFGEAEWLALSDDIARAPLLAVPRSWPMFGVRALAGCLGFALLLGLHPVVFGVSPLPVPLP